MSNTLNIRQVSKILDISTSDVEKLVQQGLLHPLHGGVGGSVFLAEEIYRIKNHKGLTISQEAAQVGARMEQKVVATVNFVQNLVRKVLFAFAGFVLLLIFLILVIAVLFKVYPDQTAQFFGFYYTYNVLIENQNTSTAPDQVLGESTEDTLEPALATVSAVASISATRVPLPDPIQPTLLARLLKPVAAVSLLIVKATDNQQYQQIITIPPGLPGAQGDQGVRGLAGPAGETGSVGPRGSTGETGAAGATGDRGDRGATGDAASGSIGMIAGSGLSGGGSISLGSSGTISVSAPACDQDERLSWNGINFTCEAVIGGNVVSANEFYAGPVAGAADSASFRAIAADDIGSGVADANTVLMGDQSWMTLLAGGKIDSGLLPSSVTSGLKYQGSWNANTNAPTISSGPDTAGNFYIVDVAGSTTVDGVSTWDVGDWIVNNGSIWERVPSTSAISSVNGLTGAVVLSSDEISQGTVNKYFSNTLARNALGGAGPVSYSAATGTIDCPTCVVNTGNGTLFGSGGLSLSGSSTNRLIGAGDLTVTLDDTTVSPGTYGSATTLPVFTVNAKGRLTAASSLSLANTAVSGDVSGTLGATAVNKINGATLGTTTASSGNVLIADGSSWITRAISGDATISNTGAITLKNTGTAGTYGAAGTVPVLTTDAQGRVTSVTNTTISGLSASNLAAGDYSSKINTGSYSIDVTGSAASFTGSLLGDVTGTQGVTTVSKINGATLGTTTASSGNVLIADGSSWITRAISGDATISNTGAITLKNTGTAGTYGAAGSVPVLTTDAQGRVTSVTNTTISGLSASNLSAGNYSSKINTGTYTIDILGAAASFTGSLLGDVSGTQGVTTVARINGVTLGTTTATTGNILVGNGTAWVTQTLGGDATLNAAGVLTLNYAGGQAADATHKGFLTAADWITFNSKQAALGYTAEDTANKSSDSNLGTSNTLYPTQNAVKTYVDNLSTGLNWQSPVESVNVIADTNTPVGTPATNDAYIINTGGATGAWSSFAAGDLVQWQGSTWVKLKSLAVGDRFGVAYISSTTPGGALASKKNNKVQITGGSAGAFSYTFTVPTGNDALYVANTNDFYQGVSFTYSTGLVSWVQFSSSTAYSFGNGLSTTGNTVALGPLTADWDQTGAFDITTAGNINLNGGALTTTASTADVFNTGATTVNLGGAASTINLGAAGASVVGGGALTVNSGTATTLTLDSGTTGTVNLGTGANAKAVNVGSSTVGTTLALRGGLTWSMTSAGALTTAGGITTTGTGTITSAGLVTASNGLTLTTGALNLTSTSGALSLTGLGASSINTGANNLTITAANFNTTATGINGTSIGVTTPASGAFTTVSSTGQITSTVSTGTAPLVVASTTNVPNLNASSINGLTFAAPGAIGGGTAATGTFTALTANTSITNAGLSTAGVVTNTAGGLLGTLAGTSNTVLHGNASGLPTFSSVVGTDLAANISISTTGNLTTTGTGTISSAGLLTAANGLTLSSGALNMTASSGTITLSGLGASSISTGATNSLSLSTGTTGALTLDSGTTGAVNIGTNANAKSITVGNNTGATAVNLTSGTGGITLLTSTTGNLSLTTGTTGSVTLDSGTTGAVNIGTNANAKTITIGNGSGATSLVLDAGTGNIDIGQNAVAHTIRVGNSTGATAVNLTSGTGGITLLTSTTGNLSLTTGTTGSVTLDSGTTGTVNIGTNANAKTVTVGNSTGATAVNLTSGTGGITLLTTTTGALSLDSGTSGAINIGTNANAKTITVGNSTGATAVNLTSGTGGITLLTGTTGNLSLTTGTTGAVTLDSGTTGAVNIGTNANAKTVTVGNTTGATVANIRSGTGGISLLTGTTGNLSLTTGTTGAVTLDSGTTGAVNIGTNANAKTISIGNTTGATSLTLSGGTGGVFMNGLATAVAGNFTVCVNTANRRLYLGASQTQCNPSSARYKNNIEDVALGLDAVNRLRPVSYTYNSNGEETIGFIAEEAAIVDPRLVVFDAEGRPNALNSDAFIPILTKGLQELDLKVNKIASSSAQTASTPELITTQISQAMSNMFNQVAEFFQTVIFHGDVRFLGRPTFNKDTAGFAQINPGSREVTVRFERAYEDMPIVVVSPYSPILFAVEQVTPTGFTIKIEQPVAHEIKFGWTATAVSNPTTFSGQTVESSPMELPSPVVSPSPVVMPSPSTGPVATEGATTP